MPWQANNHNLVDHGANGIIVADIIPDEAETTAVESQAEISSDDPGGQVAHLLSTAHAKTAKSREALVHKGKIYHLGKHIWCQVSQHDRSTHDDSLVDRGANGGFGSKKDMKLMAISATQKVNVVGINNTTCSDMPVVTAASVITTLNQGPCVGIFHQCAWNEDGGAEHTIHSPFQLEAFGHEVSDKAAAFGGKCMFKTLEGDVIPLGIKDAPPTWKCGSLQSLIGTNFHKSP